MTAPRREIYRKTTLSDVAALAGVSIKTVSRVLNREPKVHPATRQKVEAAMEELRYRPNSPGRMLASSRSYILGLVYNASSSYITSIQNGALDACRQDHYDLLIHPCHYRDPAITREISDLVTSAKVDGLLLTPPVSDLKSVRSLVRELQVPYVSISRRSAAAEDWAVGTNDREVCRELTAQLAREGHRRVAFVRSHPDHKAMSNRYRGFLDGMAASGLEVDPDLVVAGDNTFESGIRSGNSLLQLASPPTAVFCANDHMAAGVMAVAHERGIRIPDELSVAGFDDIPLARQIWPAMTTIRQPLREMAGFATQLLIQRLRGQKTDHVERVVAASIVLRDSTGPAPGREKHDSKA